jgi:hypothetical protein
METITRRRLELFVADNRSKSGLNSVNMSKNHMSADVEVDDGR